MSWITEQPDGIVLNVHVVPRSGRDCLAGLHGDALKVKLAAPPAEGKANRALTRLLSELLGVPPLAVTILSGAGGRAKRVAVRGVGEAGARRALGL